MIDFSEFTWLPRCELVQFTVSTNFHSGLGFCREVSLKVKWEGKVTGGLVKTPITEIVASFTTVSQWTNLVAVQLAEDVERKLATSETARREAANDKSVSAGVKAAVADCDQGRQG